MNIILRSYRGPVIKICPYVASRYRPALGLGARHTFLRTSFTIVVWIPNDTVLLRTERVTRPWTVGDKAVLKPLVHRYIAIRRTRVYRWRSLRGCAKVPHRRNYCG